MENMGQHMINTKHMATNDRVAAKFQRLLFSFALAISTSATALGASTYWEGTLTGGVFNDDENWNLNSPGDNVPNGQLDQAHFNSDYNVDGTITFDADVTHQSTFVENATSTLNFDTGEFKWTMTGYLGIKNDFNTETSATVRLINGEVESNNVLVGYSDNDRNPQFEIVGSTAHWHTLYLSGGYGIGYAPMVNGATMIVKEGGRATSAGPALVGLQGSSNGKILVDGVGSELTLGNALSIGYTGYTEFGGTMATDNRVEVTNGAHLTSSHLIMAITQFTSDSTLLISGAGSKYTMTGVNGNDGNQSHIGRAGDNNLFRIENGAVVEGNNRFALGAQSTSTNNKLEIVNGSLSGTGLEIYQQGNVSITNGTIDLVQWFDEDVEAYKGGGILAKNPLATFTFNSGTIKSVNADVTNSAPFAVGTGGATPATYLMRRDQAGSRGTHVFASGLALASNGVLAGNGNITANVSGAAGAKVDVGESAGLINVTGAWNNTGIGIALELDNLAASTVPGVQFDQLNVSGAFTHGGSVAIDVSQLVGPAAATPLKLIGWGSQVGASASTIVSFLGGAALPYVFQADGLYVTAQASAALAGDYNSDGKIDAADYTVWRDNLGAATIPNRGAGITGVVGPDDYNYWKSHFGMGAGSAAAFGTAVPEPGTIAILLAVLPFGLLARRGNRS
jgi:hypothetical protein